MPAAPPPAAPASPDDWFARAAQRCEGLPSRLAIRQRLAVLQAELAARGIAADDPAVPAMIAALFPPGTLTPAPGAPPTDAPPDARPNARGDMPKAWPDPARPTRQKGLAAWWRALDRKRGLLALRWLAPLLLLALAADAPVPEPRKPEVPCEVTNTCPLPPPTDQGHWERAEPREVVRPNPRFYLSVLRHMVGALVLWLLALVAIDRLRRHLRREANPDLDPVLEVALRIGRSNLFGGPAFEKVLRQLRAHQASRSRRLDVRRSLRATIARGGLPELRFGLRRRKPEYLLLSEREMPGDHLPEVGRALRDRLAAGGLAAQHYEFTGAPWRLRADPPPAGHAAHGGGGFEAVEAVMARHADARVMLCAEGPDLFDELADAPGWIDAIAGDHRPLLLNPRGREHWHAPETRLSGAGLAAVEAAAIDPRALSRHFAEDAPAPRAQVYESPQDADLPTFLDEDRDLLLSEETPDPEEIEAVLFNLEHHWLAETDMRWLRTLALFPLVHPSVTYFAGMAVFEADRVPPDSYLRLVRLPWFRAGTMPGWLRQVLINGMDQPTFERARQVVQAFFSREAGKAQGARDIVRLCDRLGTRRQRRRFAQGMRRSDIPALKDDLLRSAFACEDPAEVTPGADALAPSRGVPRRVELLALLAICLGAYLLFTEPRTLTIKVPQPPVFVRAPADPRVTPPDAPPAPDSSEPPTLPPSKGEPVGKTPPAPVVNPVVYVHIASEDDRAGAQGWVSSLASTSAFRTYGLKVAGIEYRTNSPAETQVRCFDEASCKVALDMRSAMSGLGLTPAILDLARSSYGGVNKPLEIWFADKDIDSGGSGPPPCNPGPYIVYFDWDKSDLTPEATALLDAAAQAYGDCPGRTVVVAGHTDSANNAAYSIALSERMARSVADYLAKAGVPQGAIETRGYGRSNPQVQAADGVREAQNRRVEITFEQPASAM